MAAERVSARAAAAIFLPPARIPLTEARRASNAASWSKAEGCRRDWTSQELIATISRWPKPLYRALDAAFASTGDAIAGRLVKLAGENSGRLVEVAALYLAFATSPRSAAGRRALDRRPPALLKEVRVAKPRDVVEWTWSSAWPGAAFG